MAVKSIIVTQNDIDHTVSYKPFDMLMPRFEPGLHWWEAGVFEFESRTLISHPSDGNFYVLVKVI